MGQSIAAKSRADPKFPIVMIRGYCHRFISNLPHHPLRRPVEVAEWVRADGVPAEAACRSYCWERGSAGGDGGIVVEDSGYSAAEASHSLALASLGTFSIDSMA